jgi:hypothetical protein
MFLYYAGKTVRKLTGKGGNYGIPKRYLEIESAELFDDWAEKFKGRDI